MNRFLHTRPNARRLLCLALTASLAQPLSSLAASIALATVPLVTATTSTVKPNLMFILDDSGSMDYDYLPDWASGAADVLFNNAVYNGVYYNPAITYTPPVYFNADGTLNSTAYPGQTGQTTATGANSSAKPNWNAVDNDGYGVQSSSTSVLTGNASFYTIVPGEYCNAADLKTCVAQSAPSTGYPYPAPLRWCTTTALTTCQGTRNSTYQYPRYPISRTATIDVNSSGSTSVTHITVGGSEILSAATAASTTRSIVAANIANAINACTAAITGQCAVAGFSASVSGEVVTITANGTGTFATPVVTDSGGMTYSISSFSGGNSVPGSNRYINITPTTASYSYPGTTGKAVTRSDCAGTSCTYAEEMINYANWWAYYHTRMQAMKTSVSRAFQAVDNRFRVGFSTIHNTGASDGTSFLHIDTFELAQKNTWFNKLFAGNPGNSTPLRGALSKAGRMYAKKVSGQTIDPVQYSCQQNFTILSTDGYWNTGDETSSYKNNNLTGGLVGDMDSDSTTRPMYEGPTASSGSLADIAKYYYDTDLRTSPLSNCAGGTSTDFPSGNPDVCTNNVFISSSDNNVQQHMTTFTMGLGVDGILDFTTDYQTATSGDYYKLKTGTGSPTVNWPDPQVSSSSSSVIERIDDLWHAAVNGHGVYFSAKDPNSIITGFNQTLSSITARLGSAAAAASSTLNPVAGNNYSYVASYTTVTWKGNLEARTINTSTGAVSETATWCVENIPAESCASPGTIVADTSGSSTVYNCVVTGSSAAACTAPGVFDSGTSICTTQISNACTGTMPGKVGATTDSRNIYTANSTGTALVNFDASYATANPTNFAAAHINSLSQWGSFTSAQQTAAAGVNLINFLRGQNGFEDRATNAAANRLYRAREAVLGDALESQPAFISNPVFSYPYPGYSDYKTAQAGRSGTVYLGANDGMMHAFATNTGFEMVERWAYVPSMVIPNMWKLADKNYANLHTNFVNGSAITSDICIAADCSVATSADWKTILVAGLNAGGRGYYALDITNPVTPTLLWEFTPTTGNGTVKDDGVGYGFGQPVIARKADGTWVVLVTSGYNNTSPGDGRGYLYVLNARTGAIISKITTGVGNTTTPSGLAKIAAWNNEPAGNLTGYVYGGDLLGNVWRFDINSSVSALIGKGAVMQFATLFSDSAGTQPQPITATPVLGKIAGKRVVFIGTGKYLEISDLTNTQLQSEYAIKDDDATATLVNPRNTLVRQTITTTGGTRTVSNAAVNFYTGRGWYVDFPDGGTSTAGAERVNVDSKLSEGTLLVPTIVPSNTICSPGGYGWLNYFNYANGGAINTSSNLASMKYDAPIVGLNILNISGRHIVEVVTANNPTPVIALTINPGASAFTGKRVLWRELIPQ